MIAFLSLCLSPSLLVAGPSQAVLHGVHTAGASCGIPGSCTSGQKCTPPRVCIAPCCTTCRGLGRAYHVPPERCLPKTSLWECTGGPDCAVSQEFSISLYILLFISTLYMSVAVRFLMARVCVLCTQVLLLSLYILPLFLLSSAMPYSLARLVFPQS